MPIAKRWQDLSRAAVGSAPAQYGVYELGDGDGEIVAVDWGVLRDELKDALAYGSGEQVRWKTCQTEAEARERVEEHRERAGLD